MPPETTTFILARYDGQFLAREEMTRADALHRNEELFTSHYDQPLLWMREASFKAYLKELENAS